MLSAPAGAQRADRAAFTGRVLRTSDRTGIAGAEVSFPSLGMSTSTDSTGAFRFPSLPVGLQAVRIRHLGSDLWRDTVTIGPAGTVVTRTYTLSDSPAALDTVRAIAGKVSYRSPALRAFEDRRLSHAGGYFVSDSVFRQNENTTMANIIQPRMPGISWGYFNGHKVLISGRKPCRGLAFRSCNTKQDCFVAIYVDGTLYYNAKMADEQIPFPDMEKDFNPANFAGAEYYAGGASMPMGMHPDDDGCGSLWLWTRER
jgi:hypothetical protein